MTIDEMLSRLRGYKMTPWEKRSQAIDFAVGNLLATTNHVPADEWLSRKWAAEAWDERHGAIVELEAK